MVAAGLEDISTVVHARRHLALPIRLVRAIAAASVLAFVWMAFIAWLAWLMFDLLELAVVVAEFLNQPGAEFVIARLLSLLGFGLLTHFIGRGWRMATLFAFAWILGELAFDFMLLVSDLLAGYPVVDANGMSAIELLARADHDPRVLPMRLFGMAALLGSLVLVGRIAAFQFLPRWAAARRYQVIIFSEFRPGFAWARTIVRMLRAGFMRGRVLTAGPLLLMSTVFIVLAVCAPFTIATPNKMKNALTDAAEPTWGSILGMWPMQIVAGVLSVVASRFSSALGNEFRRRGEKWLTLTAEDLLRLDRRPPVLYLRSFRRDNLPSDDPHETGFWWVLDAYRQETTLEQVIARRLQPIGPTIAIADPKTPEQLMGAARRTIYAENWHEIVSEYMREAVRVLVLLDDTENLRWEILKLRDEEMLGKAIFVVPPVSADERGQLLALLQDMIGVNLLGTAATCAVSPIVIYRNARGWRVLTSGTTHDFSDYDIALQIVASG